MSIEVQRKGSLYVYRISPTDPLLVERKANQHGARWCFYAHRDTANEAKALLLAIGKDE